MRKVTAIILFAIIMGVGGVAYAAIRLGWYPVAIVNNELVSARVFQKEFSAAFQYQLVTVPEEKRNEIQNETFLNELRVQVLDDLIEKRLVGQNLHNLAGKRVLGLLDAKIASANIGKHEKIEETVMRLYGLEWKDFHELVIIPQAEREVLQDELRARDQKKNLAEHLAEERKNAKVHIFSDFLDWNGEKVSQKK